MKPFAVIVFAPDQSVTAVPSLWISANSKQCAWPIKYPPNFKKLIKDPNFLPDPDWMWLDCEIKKRYDSYDLADTKTKKYLKDDAEASSSEVDSTPKSSRTRKGKASGASKDTESNLFLAPSTSAHKEFRALETEFAHPNSYLTEKETVELVTEVATGTGGTGTSSSSSLLTTLLGIETLAVQNQQVSDEHISFDHVSPAAFINLLGGGEDFSITVVDQRLKEEISNLRTELRQFQEVVLKKLEEIVRDNKETRRLLQTALPVQHGDQTSSSSVHIVFQLTPLQTEDDFTKLEEELKTSEESCKKLIGYLKRGGGSSLSDNVYNILRSLFTEQMSRKVRLTSKSNKLSFGESKLADCVKEAVHLSIRTDNSVATDKQINHYIGSWFRQRGYIRHAKQQQEGLPMDEEKTDQKSCVSNSTDYQGGVTTQTG